MTPPFVWSTNSNPAPRTRLDAQRHFAELAGAPGLLLVPVEALGLAHDRLAIRNARRSRVHLELELARHALQHRAQVQVAQRTQDRLVRRAVVLDDERGVLGRHPVQHFGDALLVAALLRRDAHSLHRQRELERPHVDMILIVRVVQHAVEIDVVDLRDRGDVAGHGTLDLDVLASLQHEEMADLEGFPAVADVELRVFRHRALVDTEDAELADEWVHHDLEHMREHVHLRIGLRAKLRRRIALPLVEERRISFRGAWRQLDEHVEQLGNSRTRLRRDEADRHEMAVAQRLLERRVKFVRRDLPLLEVLRHQRFVDFDDLVDERAVRAADRREVRLAVRIEEAVDDALAALRGQVDRQAFLAEHRLDRREEPRQIGIVGVDLVDDDKPAQPALRGPLHHPRRDHLDAGLSADDDRRGLDGVERTDRLADEIGESGRIDEVNARVAGIEMHDRGAKRVLRRLFERVEVAHGRAPLDRAGLLDRARGKQQRLRERRLARASLTDKCDSADVARGVVRHG